MKAGGLGDGGLVGGGVSISFFSSCVTAVAPVTRANHSNDARSSNASSGLISGRLIRC